jgi:hypothetical protein
MSKTFLADLRDRLSQFSLHISLSFTKLKIIFIYDSLSRSFNLGLLIDKRCLANVICGQFDNIGNSCKDIWSIQ